MAGKVLRRSGLGLSQKNWQKAIGRSGAGSGSQPSAPFPFWRQRCWWCPAQNSRKRVRTVLPLGGCVTQAELRRSSIKEEIRQLENKKKRLVQEQKEQERKDRTNRLCKRMGFIEKLLPDTIPLTEEQFKTFVEQTIATDHSRRILDGLTVQNAATAPAQGVGTAGRSNTQPAAKTAHTAQEDGTEGSAAQG